MTIEDIADFCSYRDCSVELGEPEIGYIEVDSGGYHTPYNYHRFLSFNELSGLPSPKQVVEHATTFKVRLSTGTTLSLTREQFEGELRKLREKVGR